jgi:methylglutaconyl-CoA hydratase
MLLTGELIDAVDALRMGLVNGVSAPEHLIDTALAWCRSLAEGGPQALAATKEILQQCSRQSLSVEDLGRASAAPRLGDECRSGLDAFFDKKPAPWVS